MLLASAGALVGVELREVETEEKVEEWVEEGGEGGMEGGGRGSSILRTRLCACG